jgi:hypothetical protein
MFYSQFASIAPSKNTKTGTKKAIVCGNNFKASEVSQE